VVDDCPYPQSSAKNQSNRFLIQALRDSGLSDAFPTAPVRREKEAREAVADRMVGVP